MAVKYHSNPKKMHSLNVTKYELGFQIYYGKICILLGVFIVYVKMLLKSNTHLKTSMIFEVLPNAEEKKINICTTI